MKSIILLITTLASVQNVIAQDNTDCDPINGKRFCAHSYCMASLTRPPTKRNEDTTPQNYVQLVLPESQGLNAGDFSTFMSEYTIYVSDGTKALAIPKETTKRGYFFPNSEEVTTTRRTPVGRGQIGGRLIQYKSSQDGEDQLTVRNLLKNEVETPVESKYDKPESSPAIDNVLMAYEKEIKARAEVALNELSEKNPDNSARRYRLDSFESLSTNIKNCVDRLKKGQQLSERSEEGQKTLDETIKVVAALEERTSSIVQERKSLQRRVDQNMGFNKSKKVR